MADVSSALTHAVQPDPWRSRRGGETRSWRGYELATNTDSRFLRTSSPTSGGGSGGGGSPALARMDPGPGEWVWAKPQPRQHERPARNQRRMNNDPPHPPILSGTG